MSIIALAVYYYRQNILPSGRKTTNVYVTDCEPVFTPPPKRLQISGTRLIYSTNPHILSNSRELILCVDS